MGFSNFWLSIYHRNSKRAILRQLVPERKEKNVLNSKEYIKKCVICGKTYESISARALTCGKPCRNEYHRRKDREKRSVKTCRNSTLDDVLRKAREAGMSYGKYVATVERIAK